MPKRAARIVAGWAEQKAIREIMLFLHANGVGTSRAVRIYKTYGQQAIALITENPYRLARDIRGIGFRTADLVAAKLGIEKTAMIRVRAGLSFGLAEATGQGHCGLPVAELTRSTSELIEVEARADRDGAWAGAARWRSRGRHRGRRGLRVPGRALPLGADDCRTAALSVRGPPTLAGDRRRLARSPGWSGKTGLALAPSQVEALRLAVAAKALVITGGPGVGKTTLVNSILKVLGAKGVDVALCAPTGRAAKRLTESTGLEARTIHRLLEADPKTGGFKRGDDAPARLRPAGGGRVQHGGRAADALLAAGAAGPRGAAAGGRRGPTAKRRAGPGPGRRDRLGRRAGGPAHGGVPPGGRRAGSSPTRTASTKDSCRS